MIEEAKQAVIDSSPSSSVYIGCDSIRFKKNGRWMAKYSTVVVVHKDSRHGCQIFHENVDLEDFGNLKQRLMNEVNFAVAIASEIVEVLGGRHLEVHLDLNPNPRHKSNVVVKEAIGWVRGSLGIEAKIKPYSWCASHTADWVVRR